MLLKHQSQPREGHLAAVYRVFWYLKFYLREISGRIVLDSKILYIDEQIFNFNDKSLWKELYPYAEEALPGNTPPPRDKPVYVGYYMNANHAGNLISRQYHTGIIIFVNNSQIIWYSKRQNTVE